MMKKYFLLATTLALILSVTSCQGNVNKRIEPPKETSSPASESQNQSSQKPVLNEPEVVKEEKSEPVVNYDNSALPNEANESFEPVVIDSIPSNVDTTEIVDWMPQRNKEHKPLVISSKFSQMLDKYDGYFTGDTDSKVIYLTFDEGYEYKFTPKILDVLKANDVKATFFVVKSYIKKNPDLVKRMVEEGHIVGNHTTSHPNMPQLLKNKGIDAFIKELTDTSDYFKEITGVEMPKFYRPPQGIWSEATLYITKQLGYKTILWSMAHRDWDTENQPGRDAAFNFVDTYYHNGAILLLHPQSQSNYEALDDIIKHLKNKGYKFAPLTELP